MSELGRIGPLSPSWPIRPTPRSGTRDTPRRAPPDPRAAHREAEDDEQDENPEHHIDELA